MYSCAFVAIFIIVTLSALVFPVVFLLGITRDISSSIASIAFALAALGVLGVLFGQKVAKLLHIIDKIRQVHASKGGAYGTPDSKIGKGMEDYLKLDNDDDRFDFCRKQVLEWQGRMITVGADRTSYTSSASNSHASSSAVSSEDKDKNGSSHGIKAQESPSKAPLEINHNFTQTMSRSTSTMTDTKAACPEIAITDA
jgi:hypothetical protein